MKQEYLKILGVSEDASLKELKSAFRKRAKELHPDVNPAPDAQEQFILLNEAFEYLQHIKSNRIYNEKTKAYQEPKRPYRNYSEWERFERHKARQRARQYANMKQKAYEQTAHYKYSTLGNAITDLLSIFFLLFILVFVPVIGFSKGTTGIIVSVIVVLVTTPAWAPMIARARHRMNLKELKNMIKVLRTSHPVHLTLAIVLNVYFLFEFAFSTVILPRNIIIIMVLPMALFWIASLRMKSKNLRRLLLYGAIPFLSNSFFLINYFPSTNPVTETYKYKNVVQRTNRGQMQETTLINLENDAYKDYQHLRLFFSYEKMSNANTISYHFEDGLFGIRVVKEYEFSRSR